MLDEVYLGGGGSCPDFPLSDKKKRRQNGDKDNTKKKKEKHKKKFIASSLNFVNLSGNSWKGGASPD